MEYTIYIDTASVGKLYFLNLDSMFKFINDNPSDVTAGYIGY